MQKKDDSGLDRDEDARADSAGDERWQQNPDLDAVIKATALHSGYCPKCSMPLTSKDSRRVCSECGSIFPPADIF